MFGLDGLRVGDRRITEDFLGSYALVDAKEALFYLVQVEKS